MERLKKIYHWDEFRDTVLKLQGLSDEDLKRLSLNMKKLIMNSTEKDPIQMFLDIIEQSEQQWSATDSFPLHGDWHHLLVPGVILAALRNNGYEISNKDVAEGIQRGAQARISCGFTGVCGGANSIGSVAAVIKKTTPLHDDERQELMFKAAEVLQYIAQVKRRCCKRSSYITLKKTIKYLKENNYILPDREITCSYSQKNSMCAKEQCPFYQHHL